ncbi:MAG: hypothetical protein AAB738_03600 [Patescibacteria group bacterium]
MIRKRLSELKKLRLIILILVALIVILIVANTFVIYIALVFERTLKTVRPPRVILVPPTPSISTTPPTQDTSPKTSSTDNLPPKTRDDPIQPEIYSPLIATTTPITTDIQLGGGGDYSIKFSGEISRGRFLEKDIGYNLVFRLAPQNYYEENIAPVDGKPVSMGWRLLIVNKSKPNQDFAALATPPYYGINPLDIVGWHFRNPDNTGPNNGSVNAPQEVREFNFFTSEVLYEQAYALYDENNTEELLKLINNSASKGRFTITDLKLDNLKPGEQSWIEYIKFDVELHLPYN